MVANLNQYEPPTMEEWQSIVGAFQAYGYDAHLEGGGACATCIWVDLPGERVAVVGDNGDVWTANVYANRNAFENGEPFQEVETDVPTRFDGTDVYHDPESIADGFRRAMDGK